MIRPRSSSEASADASEVNQNIGFKLLKKKDFLVPGEASNLTGNASENNSLGGSACRVTLVVTQGVR
jgi:hypothetical protein